MREKRWLLCFLVAMCCTFSAWALPSQDKTVTLKLHNVSIETVLDAVKKQTGVNMLYNSQMFKGVPSVSLDVKNERWDTTLKLVLNPQGFDYVMKEYFAEHQMMTRRDFQEVCGLARTTAKTHLVRLRGEGKLVNIGLRNQPMYVPAPGYYGVSRDAAHPSR